MKKVEVTEKFSVLLCICDDDRSRDIEEYLDRRKLNMGVIFMGKGTAASVVADIFGFGLSNKCVCAVLVKESIQDKVIAEVTEMLGIENDSYGLTMLLKTSGATSMVMDALGLQY